ncbi:phage head-tail connector protein [Sphingosinicella sp. LHD-64]|uniref:head-tail connector protein n=1 Tax=Sphingosinicella sp. LHD-64 TaxID=3072139 RepID=UPI00280CEF70|nr:phage head-tail connector protein [Sphingosinicella sp. LHD-64]MDQ8757843.1 phage head-tail connector protein [Sphingosinicella sp. LHD-64]
MTGAEPGPAAVSLPELKAFLRIFNDEEDALLAGMVRSAAAACEAFTGRLLIARAVEDILTASMRWARLGTAPVNAIEAVSELAPDGEETPLAADAFAVDIDGAGEGWVRLVRPIEAKRVLVHYRAGLTGNAATMPEALRHGIIRLAAHLYTHRDAPADHAPPAAVTALWRPWRRLRLR